MKTQTKPDISSIAGIQENIHELFSFIEHNLDAFIEDPTDTLLIESCQVYMHQLGGLFQVLELKSVTIVSAKIEQLITDLASQKIDNAQTCIDTLKQTIIALRYYLDQLIEDSTTSPLLLYPAYRDLMLFLGHQEITEFDLFHPNPITNPTPKPVVDEFSTEQLKAHIKRIRTDYQTGLVCLLKDTSNKEHLKQMHSALCRIEQVPGSLEQRTFWWITVGFLESLHSQESTIELPDRKLCGKIEQTLRHFAEGETLQNTVQLQRELLYRIAHHPVSTGENIAAIRSVYALPSLAQPDTPELNDLVLQHASLQEIQKTLKQTHDDWQIFCSGESINWTSFLQNIAQIHAQSQQLECLPAQQLIEAIDNAVRSLQNEQTDTATINEQAAMEIATALLHMENLLENFYTLPDDISDQIESISMRLKNKNTPVGPKTESPFDLQTHPVSEEIHEVFKNPVQNKQLHGETVQEILINLRQIEKELEDFFQAPAEPAPISTLIPLFVQVSGALDILGLNKASQLSNRCHHLINKFSDPNYALTLNDQNLLVDGLSSLSYYLEALKNNPATSQKIIDSAIAVFDGAATLKTSTLHHPSEMEPDSEVAADNTEPQPVTKADIEPESKIDVGVDSELLNVFLEEAGEIFAELTASLQKCQADNVDMESLTTIRRGFHTLKGSGRMVQLEFFSDAAWEMEKTLNHWLNEKKHISAGLIHLVRFAHQTFSEWCSNLEMRGETEIQTDALYDLISQLEQDVDSQTDAQSHTTSAENTPDTSISHEVTIGATTIPSDLYQVFITESKQHLETLEQELQILLEQHPATVSQPLTLAAHTLTSTSRAIGLSFIADLCDKLEAWLTQTKDADRHLTDPDKHLIQNCIQHIGDLLSTVYQQQFPDDVDLQLAHFLTQEILSFQSQIREPDEITTRHAEPINLSEYRLKKTPSSNYTDVAIEPSPVDAPDDIHDKVSTELLQTFLEEAQETIPQISGKIRAWRVLPQDEDIRINLLRLLHTLKGSVNMIGALQLGELVHATEETIEQAFNNAIVPSRSIETVERQFDQICEMIERIQQKAVAVKTPGLPDSGIPETPEAASDTQSSTIQASAISSPTESSAALETNLEDAHQSINILRVQAGLIDHLVNESGEASIIRTRIETQLNHFKQSMNDLTESIDRLHGQLREIEIQAETQMASQMAQQQNAQQSFDPLEFDRFTRLHELTRMMAESIDDVMTVRKNLHTTHQTAVQAVTQQAVVHQQLQQELIRIRTISFNSISERYYRITRKVANDLGKKVDLQIHDEAIEIDRSVLEKISASLEHLLRNAIAHGIEDPIQRTQLGKPETGHIIIDIHQEKNEIMLTVRDDGRGLDLEKIRLQAIKQGLMHENETRTDDQIALLIFAPGLTTQALATDTAGRGMGMDIVQNDIAELGGQITVSTEKSQGTVFHIKLPLTMAVAPSLLVSSGGEIFAIPAAAVEHAKELDAEALQTAYQKQQIIHEERIYPFTYLPFFLGNTKPHPETKRHNHILFLRSGELQLALQIDTIVDNSEVIVKKAGPQMMHAPGIEGATVTGDGKPALILNPLKLLQREDVQQILKTPISDIINQTTQEEKLAVTVLIVDDSLTVRKATSRVLEREGYKVLIAKQGLEAIEAISETTPNIVLTDLEMPKMNGFELIKTIRDNPDTAHVPIIIISSRTAEKHRKAALELGANDFLGKPFKEDDLLDRVSSYIPEELP